MHIEQISMRHIQKADMLNSLQFSPSDPVLLALVVAQGDH